MNESSLNCSVCSSVLNDSPSRRGSRADVMYYDCPRCGQYGLTRVAERMVSPWTRTDDHRIAVFSHVLRKAQVSNEWPLFDSDTASRIMETGALPVAQEQADNLIRWLGDNLPAVGERLAVRFQTHGSIFGMQTINGFDFAVSGLVDAGLIKGTQMVGGGSLTLTFPGWQRYEDLKRGAPSGRNAFMAMQYGDPVLDGIVMNHFRSAVQQTGFDLRRLDDEPRAGLIDARMMLAIKAAWFVVADLTHGNHGAYWEAGYAAGLGKPVIYTCERLAWEKRKTHFDTNHHLHVLWDTSDMAPAIRELKATIRFTIPEAKQQDDD